MPMQPGPGGPPPQAGPAPGGPEGGGAPQEGGPEIFMKIGQAMAQLAPALEGAPPEVTEKFQMAVAAYDEFLQVFGGGGQGAPSRGAPEQAGNPNVQPVR